MDAVSTRIAYLEVQLEVMETSLPADHQDGRDELYYERLRVDDVRSEFLKKVRGVRLRGSRREIKRAGDKRYRQEMESALAVAEQEGAQRFRRDLGSLKARFEYVVGWKNSATAQKQSLARIRVSSSIFFIADSVFSGDVIFFRTSLKLAGRISSH